MENAVSKMPELATLVESLTGMVSSTDILTIMGTIVGGTVTIYLTWKFGRKLVHSFLKAITGGKVSF